MGNRVPPIVSLENREELQLARARGCRWGEGTWHYEGSTSSFPRSHHPAARRPLQVNLKEVANPVVDTTRMRQILTQLKYK